MVDPCENLKTVSLSIPFSSNQIALLVQDVLNIDKELRGSGVQREITAKNENLFVKFNGADLKKLRVAVNSVIKNIQLIVKTINQFPNSI